MLAVFIATKTLTRPLQTEIFVGATDCCALSPSLRGGSNTTHRCSFGQIAVTCIVGIAAQVLTRRQIPLSLLALCGGAARMVFIFITGCFFVGGGLERAVAVIPVILYPVTIYSTPCKQWGQLFVLGGTDTPQGTTVKKE
eukprot:SAG22_NODE_10384_length_538_cov_1.056948_1_plen_140_part_00